MEYRAACLASLLGLLAGCQAFIQQPFENLPPTAAEPAVSEKGWVSLSYFDSIGGARVSDLLASDRYPENPSEVAKLQSLQVSQNRGDYYGTLVSGYLIPPTDGLYRFYVSGDDETQFWLSSDNEKTGLALAATVPSYSGVEEYNKYSSQVSSDTQLSAGTYYYFELRHKEGSGSDHFSVAWEGPGISRSVIGAAHLASPGPVLSLYPDDDASRKAYLLGYRVGFFDGTQGLKANASYPPTDNDQDGLYDSWEVLYGLDVTPASSVQDSDGDLLTAEDEFLIGTNPVIEDSDADGIPDGAEFAYQLDPLDPSDAGLDADGDGASNFAEYLAATDPLTASEYPVTDTSMVDGLSGQYFNGSEFDQFVLTRLDNSVNFDWAGEPPMGGMAKDVFTVRWFGSLVVPESLAAGSYYFNVRRDDGARIYLDGAQVLDAWVGNVSSTYKSDSFVLEPGTEHDLRVEFREGYGSALINVSLMNETSDAAVGLGDMLFSMDLQSGTSPDTDGDGMVDLWELENGLNPRLDDANQINNTEGITNLAAYNSGLSPWTLENVGTWTGNTPEAPAGAETSPTEGATAPVTLSWVAPSTRIDGSKIELSEIDYYEISYGQALDSLDNLITVDGAETNYTFDSLNSGTWYFEVRVVDNAGLKSSASEVVSYTVE